MKHPALRSFHTMFTCALFALASVAPSPVNAQHQGFLNDETLNYSGGSVKTYNSLADAQAGTNVQSTSAFPTRDISLYMVKNSSYYATGGTPNEAVAVTNWYSGDPSTNPNNTGNGFLQLYDTDGGSLYNEAMSWINPGRTTFTMFAAGSNTIPGCSTIPPQDCARMWDGAGSGDDGSFFQWSMSITASGLAPATFNGATGMWESHSRPTSVSGNFSGIFFDTDTGKYIVYDVPIDNSASWAYAHGYGDTPIYGAADTTNPIPEPATISLLAIGLVGMAGANLRRRRKTQLT